MILNYEKANRTYIYTPGNEIGNIISETLVVSESIPDRLNVCIDSNLGLNSSLPPRNHFHLAIHLSNFFCLEELLLDIDMIIVTRACPLTISWWGTTPYPRLMMIMRWPQLEISYYSLQRIILLLLLLADWIF